MATVAFLFPGQAAQRPGMASAWEGHPAGEAFDRVGVAAGLDLRTLADDADACGRSTALAQPAIHAASLAAFDALLDAGVQPDHVAGHSLGEVTAAVAAGVMERRAGASLVAERGRAMAEACQCSPGTMAAVLRLDLDEVEALVARVPDAAIANNNAPGQVVVAGPPAAVDEVAELASGAGARVRMLDVEGAFHSPAMTPAVVRVNEVLLRTELDDPTTGFVSGVDGRPRETAREVATALVDGILSPVRWVDVQHTLAGLDVDLLVECGPGGILAGCAKRTLRGTTCLAVAAPDDVDAVTDHLADQLATV